MLVVHNRYSSRVPSGENLAVDDEIEFLREAGVEVHVHEASNDDAMAVGWPGRARQALWAPWSVPERRRLDGALDEVRPDLVHVHNLFPLLTGSVPAAALRRSVPVVWTVHNLRALCIAGTHHRDNQPCHDCRPGWRVPGIRHRCYQGSYAASAVVTGATALFRRTARRHLTAVAISHSVRDWLIDSARFPADQVVVKYYGIPGPAAGARIGPAESSRTFLFAGKLEPYKGGALLLDAWARADLPDAELRVVGDGPFAGEIRAAAERDPRIRFLGPASGIEMAEHFARSRVVLMPSIWDEPFGRVAAEALAHGRPVVTTGLGGLREIVSDDVGWVTGTDPGALARALVEAGDDTAVASRAVAARDRHATLFSPEATARELVGIYTRAVGGGLG